MRRFAILVVIVATALVAAATASAQAQVRCSSTMTVSGNKLIVIGTGVGCATAKSIVRGLVGAPSIGTQRVGTLTLVRLRSPRAGWRCVTTSPVRSKGAGCSKVGTRIQVIYVNTSAR